MNLSSSAKIVLCFTLILSVLPTACGSDVMTSHDASVDRDAQPDHAVAIVDGGEPPADAAPRTGPFAPCAALGFGSVRTVAVTSTGSMVAVAASLPQVLVYSADGATVLHRLPHPATVASVAFSADDTLLATAGEDGVVRVWNVAHEALLQAFAPSTTDRSAPLSVAFAPTGTRLASASAHALRVWDLADGSLLYTAPIVVDPFLASRVVAFSPDGSILAAGGYLFHAVDGSPIETLLGPRSISAVAFTPDGRGLVTLGDEHMTLMLWNLADATVHAQRDASPESEFFTSIAFQPDGRGLVLANEDHQQLEFIPVTDASGHWLPTLTARATLTNVAGTSVMAFAANDSLFALASGGTVDLFAASLPSFGADPPAHVLDGFGGDATLLALSPDGGRLVTVASRARSLRVFDVASQTLAYVVPYSGAGALSPDGATLVTATDDTVAVPLLVFRDAASGTAQRQVGLSARATSVTYSPDGSELAVGGSDGVIHRLRASDGTVLATFDADARSPDQLIYSPDGQDLASLAFSQSVTVLRASDGAVLLTHDNARLFFSFASFSSDGLLFAQASASSPLGIDLMRTSDWSVASSLATEAPTLAVAFDPRGEQLAVGDGFSADLVALDGTVVQSLQPGSALAFSHDGSHLAVASNDGWVQVYCRAP